MYTIAEQQPIQCVIPSLLEYLLQYYTYSKEPGIEASIMQTNLILRMNHIGRAAKDLHVWLY